MFAKGNKVRRPVVERDQESGDTSAAGSAAGRDADPGQAVEGHESLPIAQADQARDRGRGV
jgi:hypothetical protein